MKITDLPVEIIRNHIIPYTYSPQSDNLCRDITTFYFTYHKLMERQKRGAVYLDYSWCISMLNSEILQFYREKILHLTEKEFCKTNLYKKVLIICPHLKSIRILLGKMRRPDRLKFMLSFN